MSIFRVRLCLWGLPRTGWLWCLAGLVALAGSMGWTAEAKAQSSGQAERRALVMLLEKTMVEQVQFEKATAADWLAWLRETMKHAEKPVNFVMTPAAQRAAEGRTISLELRKVPVRAVLDYGARLLELEVRVEPYAIIIRSPGENESSGKRGPGA